MAKEQVESLTAGTTSAVRNVTGQVVQDVTRVARESATELTEFLRRTNGTVEATLQQFEARLGAFRLPSEAVGEKLAAGLAGLAERADLRPGAATTVTAPGNALAGGLGRAREGARDASRACS